MYQLNNVSISFDTVDVLKNIDLVIDSGKLVTLVGKSGSGKSTFLKALAGYLDISSGNIYLQNRLISQMPISERLAYCTSIISFVWQDFKLIKDMSVEHNIILPLLIQKKTIDTAHLNEIVHALEISHLLQKMPYQISGGEQQRCALARALITKPKIIIADEPTGALDSATSQKLIELIQMCRQKFVETVIIATHDSDLSSIGELQLSIKDGQVSVL